MLGGIKATRIRLSQAVNDGFPLLDLFDDSQALSEFASTLFADGFDEFSDPVRSLFPELLAHDDLLQIHELAVRPLARGQRLGASALHRFMTDWGGDCSLVAIRAIPMQFWHGISGSDDWTTYALDQFTADRETATKTLENLFGGLGFKHVPDVPYLLFSPLYRPAPIDELAVENTLQLPRPDNPA